MMCGRSGVIFPVSFSQRIFSRCSERCGGSILTLFSECCIYGEIGGAWCSAQSGPLVPCTYLEVRIILDPRKCRIEHILIKDILCILRTLLCTSRSRQEDAYN